MPAPATLPAARVPLRRSIAAVAVGAALTLIAAPVHAAPVAPAAAAPGARSSATSPPALVLQEAPSSPITTLEEPWDIELAPDGSVAYVVDVSGQSVSVLDPETGTVLRNTTLLQQSRAFAVDPSGLMYYSASPQGGSVVSFLAADGSLSGSAVGAVPDPGGMAVAPSGDRLWVTDRTTGTVRVFAIPGLTQIASVPVEANPVDVLFSADGSSAYIANSGSSSVTVVDTTTLIARTLATGLGDAQFLTLDGGTLWVSDYAGGAVTPVDTTTGQTSERVELPAQASESVVSTDGRWLFVGQDAADGAVAIVDLASRALVRTVPTSIPFVYALTSTRTGDRLIAGSGGDSGVALIDVADLALTVDAAAVTQHPTADLAATVTVAEVSGRAVDVGSGAVTVDLLPAVGDTPVATWTGRIASGASSVPAVFDVSGIEAGAYRVAARWEGEGVVLAASTAVQVVDAVPQLAATGGSDLPVAGGVAGLLLAVGSLLLVAARRRGRPQVAR
jgi:DNA-binding beta-propeller fold protein YncE